MRKPVFGVSDDVRHKPGCTATEDGLRLKISDLENKAKTKALISCAVTAQLICAFVFTYKKIQFSHNEAHLFFCISMYMSAHTVGENNG